MLYAAQIWGFERFNNVEKLFRFFLKKCYICLQTVPITFHIWKPTMVHYSVLQLNFT